MTESTDISLPRSHCPQFPHRCVRCQCNTTGRHVWFVVSIMTGSIGWWSWLFWWHGKPFVVRAPACRRCAWKLHVLTCMYLLAVLTVLVAAAWFAWPILDSIPRGLQPLAKMGAFLVWLLLIVMLSGLFAAPFDVSADADSVDYHFASKDYALDFATLNRHAEWVKVNGETIALHSGTDDEPGGEPEPPETRILNS